MLVRKTKPWLQVTSWHEVAKVVEFQLQHQSFQWILRADFLWDWLVWSPCCPRDSQESSWLRQDSQESSLAQQFKNTNSLAFSLLYGPTLTSIHDYWKNHSFDYMGASLVFQLVKNLPAMRETWIHSQGLKDPPRPSFPHSQSLPSGSFYNPLIHQRADRLKTTVTENLPIWPHGPQPCLTQWNYEPCQVGSPKMDGSWWRVLTKCGPLEKAMANHVSILSLRIPWTEWKGKKMKDELPRLVGAQYATGDEWRNNSRKNEGTEPNRKQHPVVDVTGDGSKIWCQKEQYSIATYNVSSMIVVNWMWSNRKWQEWTLTF